ncbi:hypothetical protein [Deinococcus fonticola]|uniref:hypothetical protein n=1 Tax=Deinococcus fonticola TaxID=2528713 RepID=UPI001F1157C4|nr:hypothetical protein [Deinococcus fonticola]
MAGIERDANRALGKLKGGAADIRVGAEQDIADINKREREGVAQVAGDPQAVARIKAAAARLRQTRGQELEQDLEQYRKSEQKKSQDAVKESRDRARAVADTTLKAEQELASARSALLSSAREQELRDAGQDEARKLAVVQKYSKASLDARLGEINTAYRQGKLKRQQELNDALNQPGVTRGERDQLTSAYRRDLQAMAGRYAADVAGANREASTALKDQEKAAREQQASLALGRVELAKARVEANLADARTAAQAAVARQSLIGLFKQELVLKQGILAATNQTEDPAGYLSKQKDVLAAQVAIAEAERQDRAERLRVPVEELELVKARAAAAADEATTYQQSAAARQAGLAALQRELEVRQALAREAGTNGTDAEKREAEKAIIAARKALLDAEQADRAERMRLASEEQGRYRSAAEFQRSLTVNAQLRESLEASIRASLAVEAEQYTRMAASARTEAERAQYLDKAAELQRNIASSTEESRKARLEELGALRDQQATQLELALSTATAANDRRKARLALVQDAQQQVAYYAELEALYRSQGRAQTEINAAVNGRTAAEQRIRDLSRDQVEDQKQLLQASRDLTEKTAELRKTWQDALDTSASRRAADALERVNASFSKLKATTTAYRTAMKSTNGEMKVAEAETEGVSQAIENQSKAISDAQQALEGLRSEWEAQKSAVDSLNSSLNTFAQASKDQATLDRIAQRAQQQYTESLRAAQDARARYGAGSPEYAAAVDLSAKAFQAASGAIKAAADNQAAGVETAAKRQQSAYQRQAEAMGTVPETMRKTQEAQQAAYQRRAEKVKQNAEDLAQTLSRQGLGLDLTGALAVAEQRSAGLKGQVRSASDAFAQLLEKDPGALTIKVDPALRDQMHSVAVAFGAQAAQSMLDELSRQRLSVERAAVTAAGAAAPTIMTNNTIVINSVSQPAPARVAGAVGTILDCAQRKGLKTAAKGG